jgi:GxxExxY protein
MSENELSYIIRGIAFKVYNKLGPGLLESVYERAMIYEISKLGILVESQIPVPMNYEDLQFGVAFRLDILVDEKVILEIKSVEQLLPVHHKQLLTYLKLLNKKLGLLINFNSSSMDKSIIRIVNGL